MKMLITGSNGQVGRSLVEEGAKRGLDLIGLGKAELDVSCPRSVANAVKLANPDLIINAAAYTAVDAAEEQVEAAYRINRDGAHQLAKEAQRHGIPFFHLSTDYVFDGVQARPYVESDQTNPISVYGASKRAGELQVQQFEKHLILRTSWVFGRHGSNFVKTMLRLAGETELRVVDDQVGCPTSADRIASVLLDLALRYQADGKLPWGLYHYSSQPACSWFEFAQAIFEQAVRAGIVRHPPRLTPIATEAYPTPAKRPAWSVLDCSRFTEAFGIPPALWSVDLEAVIDALKSPCGLFDEAVSA
ncbi:dTDP-4-dehydrorhamnose reductase [Stutzerimonas stutzeri]|uniref:dTDP-4-dehydrorhamnose reductase n=1 Tax=Stutzerimonas stutzeri TaxID=316 RepID=UPI000F78DFFA|nr:dTDP-4-dehydrorhamnose reductase [Stutzerimonas stutzeri]RRW31195.1 dTDP-4-dehydrorhamnose reductase [Stutzerimonas stutzeri]